VRSFFFFFGVAGFFLGAALFYGAAALSGFVLGLFSSHRRALGLGLLSGS